MSVNIPQAGLVMGQRVAIIGAPRAGKTTLADQLAVGTGMPVTHADDLIGLGWSAASAELSERILGADGPGIWEGMGVVRALRKCLTAAHGAPVDRCIVLAWPWLPLTAAQRAMMRGAATVLREIEPELVRRGVRMERPV